MLADPSTGVCYVHVVSDLYNTVACLCFLLFLPWNVSPWPKSVDIAFWVHTDCD